VERATDKQFAGAQKKCDVNVVL